MTRHLALVLLAAGLSAALAGALRHLGGRYLLDVPNQRSSHRRPTPRGGGLAFLLAFFATWEVSTRAWWAETALSSLSSFSALSSGDLPAPAVVFGVIAPLGVVSFLDDLRPLPAWLRYLVHLGTAALIVAISRPIVVPGLMTDAALPARLVLTVVGITALINLYNFMDGLDGLVAGTTAVLLAALAWAGAASAWWILVGALVGFLYWNWAPSKLFMGDVGSTALGALIALAILQQPVGAPQWGAVAVTLPITLDASYTIVARAARRENIFSAHRSHIYQRLHQAGWSHGQVASAYMGMTALAGGLVALLGSTGTLLAAVCCGLGLVGAENYLRQAARRSRA
jgi:Fuc2NAc and GlcNAc transferase